MKDMIKKKIIMVSDSFPPVPSGVSKYSFFLTKKLLERGYDVSVITGGVKNKPQEEIEIEKLGGKVIRVGKLISVIANGTRCFITLPSPYDLYKLKKIFSSYHDVIIMQGPLGLTLPYPATLFSNAKKIGIFHSVTDKPNLGFILFKRIMRPFLDALDEKIAVSRSAKNEIEKYFGNQSIDIIPPGIDTKIYSPSAGKRYNDKLIFLFVGRLDERKGADILIRAWQRIKKEGIKKGNKVPSQLFIVGDGPMRQNLENEVKNKKIEGVKFFGFVEEKKLPEIYASADICVFPSKGGESFGIVLIEAMSSGCCVIASKIKGYQDVISDGKTGILFSNEKELISFSEKLSQDETMRGELSKNAMEASKKYDWDKIVDLIEQKIKN
jgi:phosphatidylinositol alpha-mannosyltransferase